MLPLTAWKLYARELPEELTKANRPFSFSLPGAKALEAFADLLGFEEPSDQMDEPEQESASFSLPAMLPDSLEGPASLRKEIDFGRLHGSRAVLMIDHIIGKGRILLGETLLCTFDSACFTADALQAARAMTAQPCMLAVDLSDALELGRKETLSIEFDASRPAGLPGPVALIVTAGAHLSDLSFIPDAKNQTLTIHALVSAEKHGRYALRAQAFIPGQTPEAARETAVTLQADETQSVEFSIPLPAPRFVPGNAYDAPAAKLQLFACRDQARTEGMLCDSAMVMCGFGPNPPEAWLPLNTLSAFGKPAKIVGKLSALHIPAVSLDAPAPDSLYRALGRAGIAVRQYMPKAHPLNNAFSRLPCVFLTETPMPDASLSPEASAWQLCSTVSLPRTLDETLTARELLSEASGLMLDPADDGIRSVLSWLRALSVRLRSEAARQGRFHGALCAAHEWSDPDIEHALQTAFAPLHLSALPLCGAWWTGTHFSAALDAFIPAGAYEAGAPLSAQAVLEDNEGNQLARFDAPCRHTGGYVGVIEAALPAQPCVLELTTRLLCGSEIIEESTLPVYVGERGPLEAAFI